jgi:hypothetical protein
MADIPHELEQWLAREKAAWVNAVVQALLQGIGPTEAGEIRAILGTGGTSGLATGGGPAGIQPVRVPVVPPVDNRPATGVAAPPAGPAYASIDRAVGNPVVDEPPVALRTAPFTRRLYHLRAPQTLPTATQGGVLQSPFPVPAPGLVTITGLIDPDGAAAGLQFTWNGGDTWGNLAQGLAYPPGDIFSYSVPVTAGDQINVAVATATQAAYFLVTYTTGTGFEAPQGPFGAVPTVLPSTALYRGLYVPVTTAPQVIAQVAAGTAAVPNAPLAPAFTVPAPGTIGFFGFIQSGSAYFTTAVEQVNGQAVYGALNNGVTQTPGAWIGATLEVDANDVVTFSVSAACTVGSVRATYTPST